MPPGVVEIQILIRISVLVHEVGNAVERYARQVESPAREGTAPEVSEEDLAQLTQAWNQVGVALAAIRGAAAPAAGPRPSLTDIEQGLTTVRDVVRKQAP